MTNAEPETAKDKYLTKREKNSLMKGPGSDPSLQHDGKMIITKNNELAGRS